MKKILIIMILLLTTIGCELFDAAYWDEIEREDKERGIKCYRNHNGTFYCKDKYGNYI